MTSLIDALTSTSLADHASRSFGLAGDALVSIYLHEQGGRIRIEGGSYGAQWIDTLVIDTGLVHWMQGLVSRIDSILDLDFRFVGDRSSSNLDLFIDTEISVGSSAQVLGLAIPNVSKLRSWWEVVVNGPKLLSDPDYLRFAIAHEIGHVLGLEHPFDRSDGDVQGSAFSDPDADVTVMSYTKPSGGWPDFWRPADLTALVALWGLEDDLGPRDWLLQAVSGEVVKLSTSAALDRLALRSGDLLLGAAPADWVINAPPVGVIDRFEVLEDESLLISFDALLANDDDPEAADLSIVAVAGVGFQDWAGDVLVSGGSLSFVAGTGIRFTPDPDFHGQLSTVYTVSDGLLQVDVALGLNVLPRNDAPRLLSDLGPVRVDEVDSFSKSISLDRIVDADGDLLTFVLYRRQGNDLLALPQWLSFDGESGLLKGRVPVGDSNPQLDLLLIATDTSGAAVSAPLLLEFIAPAVLPGADPSESAISSGVVVPGPVVAASLQSTPASPEAPAPVSSPSIDSVAGSAPVAESPSFWSPPVSPTPAVSSESSVRLLSEPLETVAAGVIGFGADRTARLVAQRSSGSADSSLVLPSVLAGGTASDRYVIATGGFTVIADAPLSSAGDGRRDIVTGLKGDASDWFAQRVGAHDWLISREAPLQGGRKEASSVVLLADPLGRLDRSHRLEYLAFDGGQRRSRRLPIKRALRDFKQLDPIAYDQLAAPVAQGLAEVLGQPVLSGSAHSVIAGLHPAALI